jgi:hypothetical protein
MPPHLPLRGWNAPAIHPRSNPKRTHSPSPNPLKTKNRCVRHRSGTYPRHGVGESPVAKIFAAATISVRPVANQLPSASEFLCGLCLLCDLKTTGQGFSRPGRQLILEVFSVSPCLCGESHSSSYRPICSTPRSLRACGSAELCLRVSVVKSFFQAVRTLRQPRRHRTCSRIASALRYN